MDYTNLKNLKDYGNISASTDDPIISNLVTAYSAAIDNFCNQNLGFATFTNHILNGFIDKDGILTVFIKSPSVASIASASYRMMRSAQNALTALDVTSNYLDIEPHSHGTIVRFLSVALYQFKLARLRVLMTYSGGYTAATLPPDLELACRRLVWWGYKKREAPMEKTAIPELGQVIIPSASWPSDIVTILRNYRSDIHE